MIIELHILQNFAPSCLNRDDLNAPKECEFGGVRRARISSQSLKRAARMNDEFAANLTNGIGTRTKLLQKTVVDYLVTSGKDSNEAKKVVEPVVAAIGSGVDEGRTAIALYLGYDEISRIGEAVEARYDELLAAASEESDEETPAKGGKAKKAKKGSGTSASQEIAKEINSAFKPGTKAADIALFGRMIAEATHFNVDAAAQVAHAISTHAVPSEFDFFTAVDDLQPKDTVGAGMMGTQQFNSATFYRYANVHLPQLDKNLGGDIDLARAAALAFVRSFILSIPSAKQNSHAALNPPDLVFAVVREKGAALSLANAFAKPARGKSDKGLVIESAEALAEYWEQVTNAYGASGICSAPFFIVPKSAQEIEFTHGEKVTGLDALTEKLAAELANWSPEGCS